MKDKPENGQAGAEVTAIDVTPEMIEAGARILESQVFPYGAGDGVAEDIVRDVLSAALTVPRRSG